LPNCWLVIFYKLMIPHLLIPWGNHFWSGKYFCMFCSVAVTDFELQKRLFVQIT
jgi:hypothetical protein